MVWAWLETTGTNLTYLEHPGNSCDQKWVFGHFVTDGHGCVLVSYVLILIQLVLEVLI